MSHSLLRSGLQTQGNPADRRTIAWNTAHHWIAATLADPDLIAVVAFCVLGLLVTLNLILRFPDLGALFEQYNQFWWETVADPSGTLWCCTAAMIGLGAFTLASVLGGLSAALMMPVSSEPDYLTILFSGVLFLAGMILSTLLGKLVGLLLAAARFRRTCRALQIRLATLQRDDIVDCPF